MGLTAAIVVFVIPAVVIAIAGTRLTRLADELADTTGLGEAFTGAVFLGAVTSLPGYRRFGVSRVSFRAAPSSRNCIRIRLSPGSGPVTA